MDKALRWLACIRNSMDSMKASQAEAHVVQAIAQAKHLVDEAIAEVQALKASLEALDLDESDSRDVTLARCCVARFHLRRLTVQAAEKLQLIQHHWQRLPAAEEIIVAAPQPIMPPAVPPARADRAARKRFYNKKVTASEQRAPARGSARRWSELVCLTFQPLSYPHYWQFRLTACCAGTRRAAAQADSQRTKNNLGADVRAK